jgi:hypothetical protein
VEIGTTDRHRQTVGAIAEIPFEHRQSVGAIDFSDNQSNVQLQTNFPSRDSRSGDANLGNLTHRVAKREN